MAVLHHCKGGIYTVHVCHTVVIVDMYMYIHVLKASHQCFSYVTLSTTCPTPGHPSAADEAWYILAEMHSSQSVTFTSNI